jgi:protein-S-isoprenylcysteine O-methyltransferase Ste14
VHYEPPTFYFEAIIKFSLGVILIGLLVFLPAGTLSYINGWIFMGVLFIPMFIAGIIMLIKSPDLLKSRLEAKEKQKEQSLVVKLSGLMFIAGFVVAGLDYRFKLLELPFYVNIIGSVIFILSYILYAVVLKQNTFLSRTIEVVEEQYVIDTGLYSIVRHPMYTATVFLFLAMPLVLGSLLSFVIFMFYPIIIVLRIKNEEMVLSRELVGYKEYLTKVKYRLIPYIW